MKEIFSVSRNVFETDKSLLLFCNMEIQIHWSNCPYHYPDPSCGICGSSTSYKVSNPISIDIKTVKQPNRCINSWCVAMNNNLQYFISRISSGAIIVNVYMFPSPPLYTFQFLRTLTDVNIRKCKKLDGSWSRLDDTSESPNVTTECLNPTTTSKIKGWWPFCTQTCKYMGPHHHW